MTIFLFSSLLANGDEMRAKPYALKIKLKPKIVESDVYWKESKSVDWKKEIKNWRFGFLSTKEAIPPFIIYKENFYSLEKNQERFCWMSNNALLLVVNPLGVAVKANFTFSALSYEKDRNLSVLVNGKEKERVNVPEDKEDREFERFLLKNIILKPGKNEIIFYTPQRTDRLKPKQWEEKEEREVSIKFKDDMKWEILSKSDVDFNPPMHYKFTISDEILLLSVYPEENTQNLLLMSRDLDIDLEEYSFLDIDFVSGEADNPSPRLFLGIDYNGDEKVDDFLNPQYFKDINLFDLAKDKFKDIDYFKYGFKLKNIILLLITPQERSSYNFQFKNFKIYQDKSIFIRLWTKKGCELKIGETSNVDYKILPLKDFLMISSYFDSKTVGTKIEKIKQEVRFILKDGKELTGEIESRNEEEFELRNVRESEGGNIIIKKDAVNYYYLPKPIERKKVLEDEYVVLEIPFEENRLIEGKAAFVLSYKVDNPEIQKLELYYDIDKNDDGKIDGRILSGEREWIKGFNFIGTSGNMDLYEAYLSQEFPENYKTIGDTKSNFIVYENEKPLRLTWSKWFEGVELAEVGVEPRRVVISLPQGKIPHENYSIVYWPLPKQSLIYDGFQDLEIPIEADLGEKIKGVIIKLKRKGEIEAKGWFNFYIKKLYFYKKFPYPVKKRQNEILEILSQSNIPLIKLDNSALRLNDFELLKSFGDLERDVLTKKIELVKGGHKYEKLDNPTFNVEWVILEPENRKHTLSGTGRTEDRNEPEIIFKKINPTKYLVKVDGAKEPFWLVFSESFHKQWRIYTPHAARRTPHAKEKTFKEIIADYPKLKVKEARHMQKFTPQDIKYLFRKPLKAEHHLVNGYANGWYVEPEKLGLGEDFTLILYFWPQSLFYLGLGISGLTFIGCIIFLVVDFIKRRCPKK